MESDTDLRLRLRLRLRTRQAFEGLSVAGPVGAYEYHDRSADDYRRLFGCDWSFAVAAGEVEAWASASHVKQSP